MFHSNFQSGPGDERNPHDPLEQLLSDAGKQYKALRYSGPETLDLPISQGKQSFYDPRQWLAAAAVLLVAVLTIGIWSPFDRTLPEPDPIAKWKPETRQPSPHAALAAARMALAGSTTLPMPERPSARGFRFPGAPSRTSGFSPESEQSS